MKVIIAGGSGFLGRALTARLRSAGHEVVVLSRSRTGDTCWDGRTVGEWARHFQSETPLAVVNLAGKLVDCRPTAKNIAELRDSRVLATRALVEAARRRGRPVECWLQASTTAIYSDAAESRITEASPIPDPGLPQMTGVAQAWEAAFDPAVADRYTILRTSIVLADGCPAWNRLALLARLGLGGTVGSGRQWFSWISLTDWLRISDLILGQDTSVDLPRGPLIAASPHPVRNGELMAELRSAFGRPGLSTPALVATVGSVLLRTDPALALTGRHATSSLLADAGFGFDDQHLPELVGRLARAVR